MSLRSSLTVDAIYEAHFELVWRSLHRMGVSADCLDDAVQDVFLVVHRKLGDFGQRSSVKTWLYGIVVNVVRDYRRAKRRKSKVIREDLPEQTESAVAHSERDPLRQAEQAAAIRLLEELLREMSEAKREVFLLSELEQMTVPEISEMLGISLTTVYARLRAARSDFNQALQRRRLCGTGGESDA